MAAKSNGISCIFASRLTEVKIVAYPFLYLFLLSLLVSCEKEVQIDIPVPKNKIVVDGRIEPAFPPYVILTHNQAYFDADLNDMQEMFIHDAVITISDGTDTFALTEYCAASLPDSILQMLSSFAGIDALLLKYFHYCIYSTFNPANFGQVGKTYALNIETTEGKTYTASTAILPPVPLDSLWWTLEDADTLGYIWSHISEPPGQGNAYRWLAQVIGKDPTYRAPFNAAFDDKLINGSSFNFAYGYYNKGDTVAVKFCSIDDGAWQFFKSMENLLNSEGNPFAAPSSVKSNIYPQDEALGIWAGYGVYMDTIVCQ